MARQDHLGRLIDHLQLVVRDIEASKRFYYAAFVLDPDGNNIEAVHHGRGSRSSPSVVITLDDGG